jgi:thiamine biosynthesis lipoprotein
VTALAVAPRSAAGVGQRTVVSRIEPMLGGTVGVHLRVAATAEARRAAEADARRTLDRIRAWAGHLTRFEPTSELVRLNADPRTTVGIGPTLTAVLDWARIAESMTDGVVDVTMLDARLAAESGVPVALPAYRRWSFERGPRSALLRRPAGIRFDLDGVAKGWLADRALGLLAGYPAAIVDCDGDIAIRLADDADWPVGVADPRRPGQQLAVLVLAARPEPGGQVFGLATSGTSVHRWANGTAAGHHLIDPATARPASTDIVQATVLAATSRHAEALAKTAVILGSDRARAVLERPEVEGAVVLTEGGEVRVTDRARRWLA